jgi:hypothetical protein
MTTVHPSPPEPGRAPVYPWAEWLDGRQWTLVRGRDYWDENQAMLRRVRSSANARRLKVKTDASDPRFLVVQSLGWNREGPMYRG